MNKGTLKLSKLTAVILAIFCVLSFCLASTVSLAETKSKNLLTNSEFKAGAKKLPSEWKSGSWSGKSVINLDPETKYNNYPSVKFVNNIADDNRLKQTVTVEPNTTYLFTAYIKTKDVGTANAGANISVESVISMSNSIKGTSDWTPVKVYLKSGAKQTSASLTLGLGGYSSLNTGTAWIAYPQFVKATSVESGYTALAMEPDQTSNNNQNNNSSDTTSKNNTLLYVGLFVLLVIVVIAIIFVNKKFGNTSEVDSTSSKNNSGTDGDAGHYPRLSKTKQTNTTSKTSNKAYNSKINFKNKGIDYSELITPEKFIVEKKDWIIIAIITIIYAVITFCNLGTTNVPSNGWTSHQKGEKVEITLDKEVNAKKLGVYFGYGMGEYKITCLDKNNKSIFSNTFSKEIGDFYIWRFQDTLPSNVKKLQIDVVRNNDNQNEATSTYLDGTILELTLVDVNNKNVIIKPASIVTSVGKDKKELFNLFDEPSKAETTPTYLNSSYFDEIYHARTAYENIKNYPVYEWTHPPLGKYIMSFGIRIFGMNPFGWRFAGALFGVLMLPLMYLFALKLFKRRFFAGCSAVLLAFDFMHFSQSRIGTIDIFGTFFVLLMYYLIYDYFTYKSINIGYKKSLMILLATGIAFGLGSASKWIGVYAGGGLAVLFIATKVEEYIQWNHAVAVARHKASGWLLTFQRDFIVKTLAWCVILFIIVPGLIYSASYVPTYLDVPGNTPSVILKNQNDMYTYHSKSVLQSTHPFSAKWYQWPTLSKPLLAYRSDSMTNGYSSSITIMGNPAIFWLGILALPLAIILAILRKNRGMVVVFVATFFQFVPWMLVERTTYIYHFFSSVPFVILMIVYCFKELIGDNKSGRLTLFGYVVLCGILFIAFYPVISGLPVPRSFVEHYLLWFPYNPGALMSWPF